nr:DUF6731 family protein [Clostridium pasteurianum]
MANQKIRVNYYYPMSKSQENKIYDLSTTLKGLSEMVAEERILLDGEGNIQLKKINYDEDNKRWKLCFLRNRIDAPFKTRLNDNIDTAEALDDDEFVGQECCMIYDEESYIVALQNNRNSISFGGVS